MRLALGELKGLFTQNDEKVQEVLVLLHEGDRKWLKIHSYCSSHVFMIITNTIFMFKRIYGDLQLQMCQFYHVRYYFTTLISSYSAIHWDVYFSTSFPDLQLLFSVRQFVGPNIKTEDISDHFNCFNCVRHFKRV